VNIVLAAKPQHLQLAVRREVVQNQMNPLTQRIPLPQKPQRSKHFLMPFAKPEITPQPLLVNVVKRQPVSNAMWTSISGRQPSGVVYMTPLLSGLRPNFQRAEFVE